MRTFVARISLATVALAVALFATAQSADKLPTHPQFPVGYFDRGGIAEGHSLVRLTKAQERAFQLMRAKRYNEAHSAFRSLVAQDKASIASQVGLMQASRELGKLDGYIVGLNEEIGAFATKRNSDGSLNKVGPLELKLMLVYSHRVRTASSSYKGRDLKFPGGGYSWERTCQSDLRRLSSPPTKLFGLMYLTILDSSGDLAGSRAYAKSLVKKWPDFVEARLILSRLYSRGVAASRWGDGRPIPVDPAEGDMSHLVLPETEAAIKVRPDFALAYYYAGVAALYIDKVKARKYLKEFLARETGDEIRKARATAYLTRIS